MKEYTLLTLFLVAQTLHAQQNRSLIDNLQDIFYAYKVNHTIDDQAESVNLYLGDGDEKELRSFLTDWIKTCEGLKSLPISNDTLKKQLYTYISGTITNYRLLSQKGFNSPEFKTQFAAYHVQRKKYLGYLEKRYTLDQFIRFTDEEYNKTMDKSNYIRSAGLSVYAPKPPTPPKLDTAAASKWP